MNGSTKTLSQGEFFEGARLPSNGLKYVSLFSGGGVGDLGIHRAGWECVAACEADAIRRSVLSSNISIGRVFSDIRVDLDNIIKYCSLSNNIDLIFSTPPCQSFSTANSRRGKMADPKRAAEDERNSLFFYAITAINQLKPKVAVFENVPNFFDRQLFDVRSGVAGRVSDFLRAYLSDYVGFHEIQCMSAYGINQRRRRATAVYVRRDIARSSTDVLTGEASLLPRAIERVSAPINVAQMLSGFKALDGRCEATAMDAEDRLHCVPHYDPIRYRWIAEIPPGSGRSAYENDMCPECGAQEVPLGRAHCHICSAPMINRPHVTTADGDIRLVKGFKTSYRRMAPNQLASTVTTASSHFGSDIRLHPTQNRVLSASECALLQTIPKDFNWSALFDRVRPKGYAARQIIGEAVPSWFSFQIANMVAEYLI